MIIVERVSVNESDRGGTRGRKYPDSMKNEGTSVRTLPVGDLKLTTVMAMYFIQSALLSRKGYLHHAEDQWAARRIL